MSKSYLEAQLLLKVIRDLKEYLPHLVLVGGWVPYLYSTYHWKNTSHIPLKTSDIDFGVTTPTSSFHETIAKRVRKKNYGEHHVKMGKVNPFVPIVKLDSLEADVEFITPLNAADQIRSTLVGDEIKVNEIEYFDLLLENPVTITINKTHLQVTDPARFTFHKLLTFTERQGEFKREKDLYYAFYVLFLHPDRKQLVSHIKQLIATHPYSKKVRKNIQNYFSDAQDRGPAIIEKLARGTSIENIISNVKEEAYDTVHELIS